MQISKGSSIVEPTVFRITKSQNTIWITSARLPWVAQCLWRLVGSEDDRRLGHLPKLLNPKMVRGLEALMQKLSIYVAPPVQSPVLLSDLAVEAARAGRRLTCFG